MGTYFSGVLVLVQHSMQLSSAETIYGSTQRILRISFKIASMRISQKRPKQLEFSTGIE